MTMVEINKLLFILIAFAVNRVWSADANKLLLSVFYESKCPDSREFIVKQLQPAMQLLHEYVELRFVPFGKARHVSFSEFECQHGPSECRGNIVQDCALDSMKGRSDLEKVDYVVCEMQTKAGTTEGMQCVQSNNISTMKVRKCLLSTKGITLQLHAGYLTNAVKPKFIPTVTVNNKFDQHFQDSSQNNLIGSLCSILGAVSPCEDYHNSRALKYILL